MIYASLVISVGSLIAVLMGVGLAIYLSLTLMAVILLTVALAGSHDPVSLGTVVYLNIPEPMTIWPGEVVVRIDDHGELEVDTPRPFEDEMLDHQ